MSKSAWYRRVKEATYEKAPLRYELLLNANYSAESRYATLAHELGHLYCGHLRSPNDKWWPSRRGLSLAAREFEAGAVCHLVCSRLGIESSSAQYLAGYVQEHQETPPISLDCIMKAAGLIEQMGREQMKPRPPEQRYERTFGSFDLPSQPRPGITERVFRSLPTRRHAPAMVK